MPRTHHLRLREKASLLVLSVGVVIGSLVTLIVLLEHLEQGDSATAQEARSAQLTLDGFSLAIAGQRIAVQGYLVTGDPQFLDSYNSSREEALRSQSELGRRASGKGISIAPLQEAARTWQAWADGAVGRPPSQVSAAD